MLRRLFPAMGTDVEVLGWPDVPVHVGDQVEARFLEVEATLSRFREDSELSCLNRSAGRAFQASPMLAAVLRGAVEAARMTNGLFDPTLIGALEAAGYDRSFEEMVGDRRLAALPRPTSWRDVEVAGRTVALRRGARVDLGGYAKGWTVDSCQELMPEGGSWVVNAGGDLLARGGGPGGEGWLVGIEDPFDKSRDIGVLTVRDGAVATTSRLRRRWSTARGPAHHVIDPRTRLPADTGLAAVTVVAVSATAAEVLAKALFLLGLDEGSAGLEDRVGAGAVFVLDDGRDVWTDAAMAMRVA